MAIAAPDTPGQPVGISWSFPLQGQKRTPRDRQRNGFHPGRWNVARKWRFIRITRFLHRRDTAVSVIVCTDPSRERKSIMSRRTIISLCASAVLGIGCLAMVSTDASAYRGRGGVHRAGVYHGGAYRGAAYRGAYRAGVYRGAAVRRGVAVGVGAAAVGAAAAGAYGAYGAYRCGYYPYGPCY